MQTADPEPATGGPAQTVPQLPQLSGSLARVLHPLLHIVAPAGHAAQSVPAALQLPAQLLVVLTHAWLASHISADLSTPPVHDCASPHSVPIGLLPLSAQTEVPVAQEVRPSLQGLVGEQVTPAVQETQLPALHTRLVPQVFPSAARVPVSVHTDVPVLQLSVPVWQGLVGVQAPPAEQATHAPLLHTWFVPQDVPLGRFPVSAQTDMPVTHDVAPVRQTFAG